MNEKLLYKQGVCTRSGNWILHTKFLIAIQLESVCLFVRQYDKSMSTSVHQSKKRQ